MNLRLTVFFVGLAGLQTAAGAGFPKSCSVMAEPLSISGCRLTDCRLTGLNTVHLGPDEAKVEVRGDLSLLDFECDSKSSVSDVLTSQLKSLQLRGFGLKGEAQIFNTSGAMVLVNDGHWLELSALLLEGLPTISVRSVRPEVRRAAANPPQAPTPAPAPAAEPVRRVEPVSAPVVGLSRTVRANGPPPVPPPGLDLRGASAHVDVELLVDERGQVVKVLSTRGNTALFKDALQTVSAWSFEPALESGKPVSGVVTVPLDFQRR